MSWTDKKSLEQIKRLRDAFDIGLYVETGTFRGVGAKVQSKNFFFVETCEISEEYIAEAQKRLGDIKNVRITKQTSPEFLREFVHHRDKSYCVMYYLDAHFYDSTLPTSDRFVVMKELDALQGDTNCVIVIHDFASNGLGHLEYDGIALDMNLVRFKLMCINGHFSFYGNTLAGCDIITTKDLEQQTVPGLDDDPIVRDNLQYAWSRPDKTYRGLLYATPRALTSYERGELKELR